MNEQSQTANSANDFQIEGKFNFFSRVIQPSPALTHFKDRQKAQLTLQLALFVGLMFGVSAVYAVSNLANAIASAFFLVATIAVYGLARTRYCIHPAYRRCFCNGFFICV